MKNTGKKCKRLGAVLLCLVMLCGALLGVTGWTITAAEKEAFAVNFSELAALVDDDGGIFADGLYQSQADDAKINAWVDARFDRYVSRESWGYYPKSYLGETQDVGRSEGSFWRIGEDGYLHLSTPGGGEFIRSADLLTVQYEGQPVMMDNFEATVVFKYTANRRSAVMVSFNEATPGKIGWWDQLNQDIVMFATPEEKVTVAGQSGIAFSAYGEAYQTAVGNFADINATAQNAFTDALVIGNDYELTVKVVGKDVTVSAKDLTADKTLLAPTTYAGKVKGDTGYLSIGAGHSARAIKSIEVKELDENGNQVDFGTYATGGADEEEEPITVNQFKVDFADLAAKVSDAAYVDGVYTPAATDDALNDWVFEKFDMKISREGHTFLDRTDLGTPYNNGAGNSYWSIAKNGYLLSSEQGGGEAYRTMQMMTVKNAGGELAVLDNFEARIVFQNTAFSRGAVAVFFNEQTPGKMAFNSAHSSYLNQDAVFVGLVEDAAPNGGITVKGSGESLNNCIYSMKENFSADKKMMSGASAVDHEMVVKVIGSDVYVKVSTPSTGKVLWEKTYTNAVKGSEGTVSIGVGRGARAIKSVTITELDKDGNEVNFGGSQSAPVNPNNTVRYTYTSDAELGGITSYFMPIPGKSDKATLTEGTANDNWYVKNGSLMYKANSLAKTEQEISEAGGNIWNSNMAVAMLNTAQYKNFVLDVDFYVSNRWVVFGFGAKGGEGGVFSSQKDGGYTVHVESSGGRGEVKLTGWDSGSNASIKHFSTFLSPYSGTGKHHMRLIVKQGVVTVYLDDIAPLTIDLPNSYTGGYIYLGSNISTTYYDNLTVLDLDKGPFEIVSLQADVTDPIELNRDQGDLMDADAMPTVVTGYDAEGYAYTFPAEWENDEYRSYKGGNYDFKLVPALPEFKLADSLHATKTVTNNISNDFDTQTTMKYYFDHENDFLDFVTGYDDTSKGGHSTSDSSKYTLASSPTEKWKLTGNGGITNNYTSVGYAHGSETTGWDVSTLMRKDLNLTNYRLELDFTHGTSFWYPYAIIGMQDFTAYRGEKGGTYFFMEYEGRPNIANGLRDWSSRKYTAPITAGNTFFNQYDAGMSTKHHLIIEVVDGILTFQVDNSDKFPNYLANTALGGYFGIAGMGNGTTFANITITALDDGGNAVPLATADRSMATKAEEYVDTFVSGKAYTGTWKFAWNDKYVFEF